MIVLFLLFIVVFGVVAWAYFTAQRLNRLHIRTDAALARLGAALDRRDAVIDALLPELSPVVRHGLAVGLSYDTIDERAELSRAVATQLEQVEGSLPAPIVESVALVELARRFYNEAVTDTRALRTRFWVRGLRLGGTARLPRYFDAGAPATNG